MHDRLEVESRLYGFRGPAGCSSPAADREITSILREILADAQAAYGQKVVEGWMEDEVRRARFEKAARVEAIRRVCSAYEHSARLRLSQDGDHIDPDAG